MRSIYSLRINFKEDIKSSVSQVLGIQSKESGSSWEIDINTDDSNAPLDCIGEFMRILDGKYEALSEINIQRKNVSIWYQYGYHQQCNMEFLPHQMKLLGDNGIVLCISCWQAS